MLVHQKPVYRIWDSKIAKQKINLSQLKTRYFLRISISPIGIHLPWASCVGKKVRGLHILLGNLILALHHLALHRLGRIISPTVNNLEKNLHWPNTILTFMSRLTSHSLRLLVFVEYCCRVVSHLFTDQLLASDLQIEQGGNIFELSFVKQPLAACAYWSTLTRIEPKLPMSRKVIR